MSAHSAIRDRDNAFTGGTIPIGGMTNLFGVELDSFQTYQPSSREKNAVRFEDGTSVPIRVFAEVLRPTTARVIAKWDRDYLKDSPAATEQQVGKGKAVYFGSLLNAENARYLIKRYANETGVKPLVAGAPEQVEVTRRSKGQIEFYFLLNHGDSPATVGAGAGFSDVISGESVSGNFSLGPFGYRVLKRERIER
jgi:beta-galactosidase